MELTIHEKYGCGGGGDGILDWVDTFAPSRLTADVHPIVDNWPVVLARAMIDNALKSVPQPGVPPAVDIRVEPGSVTVCDNSTGISGDAVSAACTINATKNAGCCPSDENQSALERARGIIAAACAINGRWGAVDVRSRGTRYDITVSRRNLPHQPRIGWQSAPDSRTVGTQVLVAWPAGVSEALAPKLLDLVKAFSWLAPHVRFTASVCDQRLVLEPKARRTPPLWSRQVSTLNMTVDELTALIERQTTLDYATGTIRSIDAFVAEFAGMKDAGVRKQVLALAGLTGRKLACLAKRCDRNAERVGLLHAGMQRAAVEVQVDAGTPSALSKLDEQLLADGCRRGTTRHSRRVWMNGDQPVEAELAWGSRNDGCPRRLICGVNGQPVLGDPLDTLQPHGEVFRTMLRDIGVDPRDQVTVFAHIRDAGSQSDLLDAMEGYDDPV